MHAELITPADARWTAFLVRTPHDAYHLPGYVSLCASDEGGEAVAVVVEDDAVSVFLPLILKPVPTSDADLVDRVDAASPYGYPGPLVICPLAEGPARDAAVGRALATLVAVLAKRGVISLFVRLNPLLPPPLAAFAAAGSLIHHGDTVMVDLTLSAEAQWAQVRSNHRRGINQSERDGVEVAFDDHWDHLDTFIAAYHQTMNRVGAQASYFFPRSYYPTLRRALDGRVHLVLARIRGRVAAAALFFEVGGIVQYHLGGTFDEFLPLHPQKLMFHRVIAWARQRGRRVLNLGGGVGGGEDSLFHFKAGFSSARAPFHTWRVVIDRTAYDRLAGIDHDTGRFFPSYRKPR